MKPLLTISTLLLIVFSSHSLCVAQGSSDLSVLNFSWARYREALNAEPLWGESPARRQPTDKERAMVEKQYGDIIRSQDLKKAERAAARSAIKPGEIFTYKVKVQNTGTRTIKNLYWEYQIIESASPENLARRQFFCASKIKSNERKELEVFSGAPPTTGVITAKTLGKSSSKPYEEKAIINRIEYSDGSVWQRDDWSFPNPAAASLATMKRDIREPVCRGL